MYMFNYFSLLNKKSWDKEIQEYVKVYQKYLKVYQKYVKVYQKKNIHV